MSEDKREITYSGLEHRADALSAFLFTTYDGIFILGLKNRKTERFKPDDPEKFLEWLHVHGIRDVLGKTIIVNKEINTPVNAPGNLD